MKITLNELREMVKNAISEMEGEDYKLQLPYVEGIAWEDNEKYSQGTDMGRLREVKSIIESHSGYNIIGSEPLYSFDDYINKSENLSGDIVKDDTFKVPASKGTAQYSYSVFKQDDIYSIMVDYSEHYKGLSEGESFIFYAK